MRAGAAPLSGFLGRGQVSLAVFAFTLTLPGCGRNLGAMDDPDSALAKDAAPDARPDARPDAAPDAGPRCGDGVRDPGEECDGADRGGLTCQSLGYAGGSLTCTAGCQIDTGGCVPLSPLCGNGLVEAGEACDGTDLGGVTCADLGFAQGELFCRVDCSHETSLCEPHLCGDGVLGPGEECDPGHLHPVGGCVGCQIAPGWRCHGEPSQCCRAFWQGPLCTGPCVVFVDRRGDPPLRDGTSWESAFAWPQEAIDAAFAEDLSCEVWVAEGSYPSWHANPMDRLSLRTGSQLYGGFAGHEFQREDRDPVAHPTLLVGRNPANPEERVLHVVDAVDVSWALLDGFVITGGDASQIEAELPIERMGGGLRILDSAVEVSQCLFEDNHAERGGGVAVYDRSFPYRTAILRDSTFRNNTATLGGATFVYGDRYPALITGCIFEGNEARSGGGAYLDRYSGASIEASRFLRNRALFGGGIFVRSQYFMDGLLFAQNEASRGGALYLESSRYYDVLRNSVFVQNQGGTAGAIESRSSGWVVLESLVFADNRATETWGVGAVRFSWHQAFASLRDLIFSGNQGDLGPGAIGTQDVSITVLEVERAVFAGNSNVGGTHTGYRGGAAGAFNGSLFFSSCLFAGNLGPGAGAIEQPTLFYPGRVHNSTFVANAATNGPGAILATGNGSGIVNSVFWDNESPTGAQISLLYPFSAAIHRCLVQGGISGTDILDEDPLFVGYPNPVASGTWTQVSYDPEAFQTVLTDGAASFGPMAFAGALVKPSHRDKRWLHVASSDEGSMRLWGDFTGWIWPGDTYAVYDLRLSPQSPCIDAADDDYAPPLDLDGNPRVDYPGVGTGPDISDLGAYECQP